MADLALYRLSQRARTRFLDSGLSAREVARSLGTSPTQLYRLLDPTNYTKSLRQLMALLHLLGCDVDDEVKERSPRGVLSRVSAVPRIIDALIAGERDPEVLAEMALTRMRPKIPELPSRAGGSVQRTPRPHNPFMVVSAMFAARVRDLLKPDTITSTDNFGCRRSPAALPGCVGCIVVPLVVTERSQLGGLWGNNAGVSARYPSHRRHRSSSAIIGNWRRVPCPPPSKTGSELPTRAPGDRRTVTTMQRPAASRRASSDARSGPRARWATPLSVTTNKGRAVTTTRRRLGMRKVFVGSGRRPRLRRLGVVALVSVALLMVSGCVADGPPLMGTAIGGDGQATVSWQSPLAAPIPISAYVVTPWIGPVAQTPIRFNSTATTQTVTGLVNGITYTFTVVAVNALGNESASSAASNPITPGPGASGGDHRRRKPHVCDRDRWCGQVLGKQWRQAVGERDHHRLVDAGGRHRPHRGHVDRRRRKPHVCDRDRRCGELLGENGLGSWGTGPRSTRRRR